MITYFPELYPDELLYSVFARYNVHTGSLLYRGVAEELFMNARAKPDLLFVNELQSEVIEILERQKPFHDIVMEHTMYPYYARFIDWVRQEKAYNAIINMQGGYHDLLPMPKQKDGQDKCLRFCPICTRENREEYGEAYWHRKHQIAGIDLCYKHGCYLVDSKAKRVPTFFDAESCIGYVIQDVSFGTDRQKAFTEYVAELLDYEWIADNQVPIGKYLNHRLAGTKYVSKRGQQRHLELLYTDINDFYGGDIFKDYQLSKILEGYRQNPLDICLVAYFLGVRIDELLCPVMNDMLPEQRFDNMVADMVGAGTGINQTARELNCSSRTVRLACERLGIESKGSKPKQSNQVQIKEYRRFWLQLKGDYPDKSYTGLCQIEEYRPKLQWLRRNDKVWTDNHMFAGKPKYKRRQDWNQMDIDMLPLVNKAIEQLKGQGGERPRRITITAINGILGLPDKRLDLLPRCKEKVMQNLQTHKQYWAIELEWAVETLLNEGKEINYKQIRNLTNMRRRYIEDCYPLILKMTESTIKEVICTLVENDDGFVLQD